MPRRQEQHAQPWAKRAKRVGTTFLRHWKLYVFEGAELAIFMMSACLFTVLLFHPASPMLHLMPRAVVRRLCMGISMGATALLIIHSPMGKRSGAHFNPAITLTYLRLRKIRVEDAMFYVARQFAGGAVGVGLSALLLGRTLASPAVDYAVTIPGKYGIAGAFAAEFLMAAVLMGVVLAVSNRPRIAKYTSYCVGSLIVVYVVLFAPVSGFSINPARTVASAVFASLWTGWWLYFLAPQIGMLFAADVHERLWGTEHILCAKLHPDAAYPCPFLCNFPEHRHPSDAREVR